MLTLLQRLDGPHIPFFSFHGTIPLGHSPPELQGIPAAHVVHDRPLCLRYIHSSLAARESTPGEPALGEVTRGVFREVSNHLGCREVEAQVWVTAA